MFKLLRRLVALVVLLVIAAVGLFLALDRLASAAIEKGGTYALGTEVKVGTAHVGVVTSSFGFADLEVANPPGFDRAPFLKILEAKTILNAGSLFRSTVELPSLTMRGIRLRLEQSAGKANYGVITDSLKRFESKDPKAADGKKFVIREILLTDIVCTVSLLPLGGALTATDVKIDEVRLTDVGTAGNQGVALAELSSVIVKALFGAIAEKGGGLIPGGVAQDLGTQLGGLLSLGGQGIKVLDQMGGNMQQFGKVVEGLGGLLGGQKR